MLISFFFPKIDYRLEKNRFFIIKFGCRYLAMPRLLCNMPHTSRYAEIVSHYSHFPVRN